MVKMASGMDHGHVRPTTTTNDVARHGDHPANTKSCSLVLQHISLILDMHIIFNPLTSITGSGLELIKVACFLEADQVLVFVQIAGSCQLNLLKTGLDCSEAG